MNIGSDPKEVQIKGKSGSIFHEKDNNGNLTVAPCELEFIEIKQCEYN